MWVYCILCWCTEDVYNIENVDILLIPECQT